MVTLPAVIVLDRWVLGRRADNTRRLYLGLALTLLAYLLARVLIFGSVTAGLDRVQLDPSYVGARLWIAPVENLGMFTRLLLFPWPLLPLGSSIVTCGDVAGCAATVAKRCAGDTSYASGVRYRASAACSAFRWCDANAWRQRSICRSLVRSGHASLPRVA